VRVDPLLLLGYGYLEAGATVYPDSNRHLVKIHPEIDLHGALFNAWDEIRLDEGVVLGHQVAFLTGRHEMGATGANPVAASRGGIHVHTGAWIATRAMVLGGVTIGEGSMVGAGSVVTESIPPRQFWAGNPARMIRSLDD
jgi:acetyltransferase-like isoleucine patch superfamily enzyme